MIYIQIIFIILVIFTIPMLLTWFGEYLFNRLVPKKYRITSKDGFNKSYTIDNIESYTKDYTNYLRRKKLEKLRLK